VAAIGLLVLGLHRLRVRRLARRASSWCASTRRCTRARSATRSPPAAPTTGLWDWDLRAGACYYSPRWKAMVGCTETGGRRPPSEWLDRIHPEDRARVQADLDAHVAGDSPHFESEHRIRHRDGSYLFVLNRGLAVRDERGERVRLAGSQTDITLRKQAEAQILHDALHDPLTGLPNRTLYLDRLGQAVARRAAATRAASPCSSSTSTASRSSTTAWATWRRRPAVAPRAAPRLRACAPTTRRAPGRRTSSRSCSTTSRTSARPRGSSTASSRSCATRSCSTGTRCSRPPASASRFVAGPTDRVPRSCCATPTPRCTGAKALGRDRHEIFDEAMHARAVAALTLESDLRRGWSAASCALLYQPIVSLQSGRTVGLEALVRWQHPEPGLLAAADFVPLARGDRASSSRSATG
jgi:PAS domain S-box-containing protein